MRTKVYTVEEMNKIYDRQNKRENRKELVRNKFSNIKEWISNNKELIIILGPSIIGASIVVFKAISKNINLEKEKDVKDLYCYDRSLGHYWALKRELTNSEWVEIDQRKNNGERLGDILDELKVLK